jgi:hypothetical protein
MFSGPFGRSSNPFRPSRDRPRGADAFHPSLPERPGGQHKTSDDADHRHENANVLPCHDGRLPDINPVCASVHVVPATLQDRRPGRPEADRGGPRALSSDAVAPRSAGPVANVGSCQADRAFPHVRCGAPAGSRTQTESLLRRLPLPVGIRGRAARRTSLHGRPHRMTSGKDGGVRPAPVRW